MGQEFTNSSGVISFFLLTVLGLLLLTVLTRSARSKEALKLVASAPGFLVPSAMVVVAVVLIASQGVNYSLHENPWGIRLGRTAPGAWVLLIVTALCIAGQIGLLEASASGRRPGSDAFLGGIKRHALTMLAGKILLSLMIYLLLSMFRPRGLGTVLYIAPSFLLAPLIGMASLHPGKPHKALAATFRFIQDNMASVARFVTAQALFVFGLFYIYKQLVGPSIFARVPGGSGDLDMLGHSNSILSYNPYPYAMMQQIPALTVLMVVLSAFASTVFISAHWLGVQKGYLSSGEREANRRDGLSE